MAFTTTKAKFLALMTNLLAVCEAESKKGLAQTQQDYPKVGWMPTEPSGG